MWVQKDPYNPIANTYLTMYAHMVEKSSKRAMKIKCGNQKYDYKFAYHIIRLLDESIQLLETHDLDLQKSREVYKSVRRGDWTVDKIVEYFESNEKYLKKLYQESELRNVPDEDIIKGILLKCLEEAYGSIDNCVRVDDNVYKKALMEISNIAQKCLYEYEVKK
jgi:hypothetical protein